MINVVFANTIVSDSYVSRFLFYLPLHLDCKLKVVSIHAPHAGRDVVILYNHRKGQVSIHAPRPFCMGDIMLFQSTRPVRGATSSSS